jgi:2-polyprenyl-3-methyl-5-hydroxy-6-metoxy-1,4-benzoquinol methylase
MEALESTDQMSPGPWSGGKFSCVVDSDPRFHLEALRWYATLNRVAGVDPTDLIVHSVGGGRSEILDYLGTQGVSVTAIEAFDSRSPHCNKISGALKLAEMQVDGLAVLTDTDVVVLEDPRTLVFPPTAVASKPVDNHHPPLRILKTVFASAELPLPPLVPIAWHPEESTVAGNGNGGLYLIPGAILGQVARAWERWARWLLERTELLDTATLFVDQVAMAMALAAEGVGTFGLDTRWNFPTHRLHMMPSDTTVPVVIHYHENVNQMGLLVQTGVAAVDGQIDTANAAIGEIWHTVFPNATFWEWRYSTNPELGSGVGSRGKPLEEKRELLLALIDILRPASVLDVGCGDGEATKGLPFDHYTGLDLAPEAIRRAQLGNPAGDYRVGSLADHPVEAELTLCLDVLIHESNDANYTELVGRLLASATRALLISGYDHPPDTDSPMVHFHEPLSTTLVRFAPGVELYPLREAHGITTFLALKPPAQKHPRDYGQATLSPVADRHPNPLRLVSLRIAAWNTTGFYPDDASRLWEYPTTAELVTKLVKPGRHIVDIGTGVNPLVPYLTERQYVVDTVDSSSLLRVWPPQTDWDDTGFLDYAQAGFAHHSWNSTVHELPSEPVYDGAYCLSVVEHLPAADRPSFLGDVAQRINPGGVAIMTARLVAGSDQLRNDHRGQPVEAHKKHGTLKDVTAEARLAGFETLDVQTVRGWGGDPVDIGLVVMRRRGVAPLRRSLKDRLRGRRAK